MSSFLCKDNFCLGFLLFMLGVSLNEILSKNRDPIRMLGENLPQLLLICMPFSFWSPKNRLQLLAEITKAMKYAICNLFLNQKKCNQHFCIENMTQKITISIII